MGIQTVRINERLKTLRTQKAHALGRRLIPQREVAAALNISAGAYASWESGRTRPDIAILPILASYFDVSIDYLLGYSGEANSVATDIHHHQGLVWSLRRPPQTEEEEKGVEAWVRMSRGDMLEEITQALHTTSTLEVQRRIQDVVYADMIHIEQLPQNQPLAEAVRRKYGLRHVEVTPLVESAPYLLRNILLGEAARHYFIEHVDEGMAVGLAGGYSVSRMVYALRSGECRSINVYPLAVSPVIEAVSLDANSLVGALAYRHDGYNVRGFALPYSTPREWKLAEDKSRFAPTLRMLRKAKGVDIAFMGLGVVGRQRAAIDLLGDLIYDAGIDLKTLEAEGAVGDVLYHLINADGTLIAPQISELICSIELTELAEMIQLGIQVVAIASGKRKVEITKAATQAQYCNVLIIDDELAYALLG